MQTNFRLFLAAIYLSFLFISSACAKEYTLEEANKKYHELNLWQPEPLHDGRVQTLNKKGAASPVIDEATSKFIDYAKGKKVLEVGGAYGKIMLSILEKGGDTVYHLNDIDHRHLFIAAHNLEVAKLDEKIKNNVRFVEADITKKSSIDEKYDAILVARVLHFFTPSQMESALSNLHSMLKPKGRIFVIAITPYVKRYEAFIPEYEKRVRAGKEFPGFVQSLRPWLNKEVASEAQQKSISEEPFMFLDDHVLSKLFKKHGFNIIECKVTSLSYKSKDWELDGRENVILIAEKR